MLGVFALEVLVASLFTRKLIIHNLVIAIFTTLNILYLNLILIDDFIKLSRYEQVIALLVSVFILTTFMNILDENKRFAKVATASIFLLMSIIFIQTLFPAAPTSKLSIQPGRTSAENIRTVNFKSTPNVYFISFDSLIPKVLLDKHLGLKTTPYHKVLDAHFHRINNFFSDHPSTVPSLSSLLALDPGHYSRAVSDGISDHFYPGLIPSPLFEIFKHNGYETTSLYINYYFGVKQGPYVDNYLVNHANLKNGVCQFTPTNDLYAFTYMGYCSLLDTKFFRALIRKLGLDFSKGLFSIDYLIENLKTGLQKSAPQIFVGYLYTPGHTPANFDRTKKDSLKKYQQAYLKKSNETATHINKILTFIDQEDPHAIVYVFGDHGPWISRRDTFTKNSTFYVQDKFGVYGGIYPPDRCIETLDTNYNNKFMTISQGARLIIKCLSGGEDAFITQNDYYLPEIENEENIDESQLHYELYLYE